MTYCLWEKRPLFFYLKNFFRRLIGKYGSISYIGITIMDSQPIHGNGNRLSPYTTYALVYLALSTPGPTRLK